MLLMVGVDIGKFVKLQVEEAGISAPPTFLDFCNFLRSYLFLEEQDMVRQHVDTILREN